MGIAVGFNPDRKSAIASANLDKNRNRTDQLVRFATIPAPFFANLVVCDFLSIGQNHRAILHLEQKLVSIARSFGPVHYSGRVSFNRSFVVRLFARVYRHALTVFGVKTTTGAPSNGVESSTW